METEEFYKAARLYHPPTDSTVWVKVLKEPTGYRLSVEISVAGVSTPPITGPLGNLSDDELDRIVIRLAADIAEIDMDELAEQAALEGPFD